MWTQTPRSIRVTFPGSAPVMQGLWPHSWERSRKHEGSTLCMSRLHSLWHLPYQLCWLIVKTKRRTKPNSFQILPTPGQKCKCWCFWHHFLSIIFPQLYWDTMDIEHCVHLRCAFLKIGVWWLYSVVLVSCCTMKWISYMHTYIPSPWTSLPPSHPTPLGHHRARSWDPCAGL